MIDFDGLDKRYLQCTYSMSAADAQAVRDHLRELNDRIYDLDKLRDGLQGAARGKITRRITPLLKQRDDGLERLKGAPPQPMDPYDVIKWILSWERELRNVHDDNVDKFVELVTTVKRSLSDTLAWKMEQLVCGQTRTELAARIYRIASNIVIEKYGDDCDDYDIALAILEAFKVVHLHLYDDIIRHVDIQGSNVAHNAVEQYKRKAQARFLQDCEWKIIELYEMMCRVYVWYELLPNEEVSDD